jgi:uncharacterized caspase-like protein
LKGNKEKALADYKKALSFAADNQEYSDTTWAQTNARKALARLQKHITTTTEPQKQVTPVTGPGRRIALVIGNSQYEHAQRLSHPDRDARAIAAAFRRLGFAEVIERHDLSFYTLRDELKRFGDKALKADWAVIYFSGHGLQMDGKSYILPVDAVLKRADHVEDEAIDVKRLLHKVGNARKLRLVILDACRNNPFVARMLKAPTPGHSINHGLASLEPSGVALVAYAARNGQIANDGNLEHSPYTAALQRHLEKPGVKIGLLFRTIREDVLKVTKGNQEPVTYGALPDENLYFRMSK